MQYPTLTELENTVEITNAFGGYNHNLRISPGEFYDMQNLTSSSYPVLSPGDSAVYMLLPQTPRDLLQTTSSAM